MASAIRHIDNEAAQQVEQEKDWRAGYLDHVATHVRICAESKNNAISVAEAGLAALYDQLQFIREGEVFPLSAAIGTLADRGTIELQTATAVGSGPATPWGVPSSSFGVPNAIKEGLLQADNLRKQAKMWQESGQMEPSAAASVNSVLENPAWVNNLREYNSPIFVVVGAGSAMCPFATLLELGATVVALDLPERPQVWEKLISIARHSAGILLFPTRRSINAESDAQLAEAAGADMLIETPEIFAWLQGIMDSHPERRLVFGAYAYADGAAHIRVNAAADAIAVELCRRNHKRVILAYLCSPTDVFAVAEDVALDSKRRGEKLPIWHALIKAFGKFQPNYISEKQKVACDGKQQRYLADNMLTQQGANYILAKRLQHWRCMLARVRDGIVVSTNVAPSSATVSVMSNGLLAAAYGGAHNFAPLTIFMPETSRALMTGLLINDIYNESSCAQPENPLENVLDLFAEGAVHGGMYVAHSVLVAHLHRNGASAFFH
jgi:hypothetical protein